MCGLGFKLQECCVQVWPFTPPIVLTYIFNIKHPYDLHIMRQKLSLYASQRLNLYIIFQTH